MGVASGLDALRLGLVVGGIEPGDEVIVPANMFAASFDAVTQTGGAPCPLLTGDGRSGPAPARVDGLVSASPAEQT